MYLPDSTALDLKGLEQALQKQLAGRKLELYEPYSKQLEFHNASADHRERLLMAGNQLGKTVAGAAEAAMHATGLYPNWWQGKRFNKATTGWVAGVTSEVVRDSSQRLLIGPLGNLGTGFIPANKISENGLIKARGVADLMDTILVQHVSGGLSRIKLKYYEQGREKFQADTIDWAWPDEEPPLDIYTEMLTRTNATGGIVWMTFTPLLGMSAVVRRFTQEPSPDRSVTIMTIDDAKHISPEQRTIIINSYPEHEREARTMGVPSMGEGAVFPVVQSQITCEAFPIPEHWPQLGALDFGWDHPTAAIKLAWDRDNDCVYITATHRVKKQTPVFHAAAVKPWGEDNNKQWLPWAWPHDGLQHDKGSGEQLCDLYRKQGLLMNFEQAKFSDGSNGVEAGIMDMLDRMETGRFKVFSHLRDWFEEFRMYHRREGKIVKEYDDLMAATRYGIMCLRLAVCKPKPKSAEFVNYIEQTGWMG